MVDRTYSKAGPYTILKTLGSGQYGTVKKAVHDTTNKLVALKFLKPDLEKESILNELMILKKLQHPNLANVIDFHDDILYVKKDGRSMVKTAIVIELAERGSVFEHLRISYFSLSRGFRETAVRTFFRQLIEALEYCHNQGIAHRDIKPDNVLLDTECNIKLCDFGMATSIKRTLKTTVGTKSYQAPEILEEKVYDGPIADIFSAGVILFILFSGHPPFKSASHSDPWYSYAAKGNFEKFWEIHGKKKPKEKEQTQFYSAEFKDLVAKMLEPDPKNRISIKDIKEHAWYQGELVKREDLEQEFSEYKLIIEKALEKEKFERREEKRMFAEIQKNGKMTQSTFNGYIPYRKGDLPDPDQLLADLNLPINFSLKRELVQKYGDDDLTSPLIIYSTEPAEVVFKRLVIIASSLPDMRLKVNDTKYKLKGITGVEEEDKVLDMTIYLSRHDDESIIINFIKNEGDIVKLIQLINEKFQKALTPELV